MQTDQTKAQTSLTFWSGVTGICGRGNHRIWLSFGLFYCFPRQKFSHRLYGSSEFILPLLPQPASIFRVDTYQ
jgi:hypothetical protein